MASVKNTSPSGSGLASRHLPGASAPLSRFSQSTSLKWASRHKAWLLVGLAVLLVVCVRVRLRDMPLERDEGEYAYAGQLILQGVPPYKEVYNMKLPGTYVAYAAIMGVLGQTPSGIHLGVMLINVASILLIFFIARRLMDETAGIVAAASYAMLSLSPSVLGLAGHATHFVVLPALGGILILLNATRNPVSAAPKGETRTKGKETTEYAKYAEGEGSSDQRASDRSAKAGGVGVAPRSLFSRILRFNSASSSKSTARSDAPRSTLHVQLFLSGLCFGLAFVMKQHGVFFGVFGGLYLVWLRCYAWWKLRQQMQRESWRFQGRSGQPWDDSSSDLEASVSRFPLSAFIFYAHGCLLPYLLTCVWLWWAGVFHEFAFWTIAYAQKYGSLVSADQASEMLRGSLRLVLGANLGLWLLALAGAWLIWLDRRLGAAERFFLVVLLACALASVSIGSYFRQHYFITLLPVLALLCGEALSYAVRALRGACGSGSVLAPPVMILGILGGGSALVGNASTWFAKTPDLVVRDTYGTTLFEEVIHVGEYLQANTAKEARIAVLGSEPEVFFYAHRRSCSGYIYMYPLMEEQKYARQMQEDMVARIEQERPEYVLYVDDPFSWLGREHSEQKLLDWWNASGAADFEVATTVKLQGGEGELLPGLEKKSPAAQEENAPTNLVLYKRKTASSLHTVAPSQ